MNNKPWGQHLILDIADCNNNISSRSAIAVFVNDIVKTIGMKAYGEPVIEHFAEHTEEAAGYSLVQLIETSAITGHFSDKNKDAYLDIFSCKSFDNNKAVMIVKKHFAPKVIHSICLSRDAKTTPEEPLKRIK